MAEIVRVRNLSDRELNLAYDGRPTKVKPGGEAYVEREVAVIHLGDWTARGEKRREEYKRIRGKHGCLPGATVELEVGNPDSRVNADEIWEDRKPVVEIYDSVGEQLTTVLDDPEGETLSMEGSDEPSKERQIEAMRQQLARLEQDLAAQQRPETTAEPPEDTPDTSRKRRGKPPKVESAVGEEE